MGRIIAEDRPVLVLHAAAYKHVPMMEDHPADAVVHQPRRDARRAAGVARLPASSASSWSPPTKRSRRRSVMGATKRLAELAVAAVARAIRAPVRGRPVRQRPRLVRQRRARSSSASSPRACRSRSPIPEMTRYFMTIPEAAGSSSRRRCSARPATCSCSTWASPCGSWTWPATSRGWPGATRTRCRSSTSACGPARSSTSRCSTTPRRSSRPSHPKVLRARERRAARGGPRLLETLDELVAVGATGDHEAARAALFATLAHARRRRGSRLADGGRPVSATPTTDPVPPAVGRARRSARPSSRCSTPAGSPRARGPRRSSRRSRIRRASDTCGRREQRDGGAPSRVRGSGRRAERRGHRPDVHVRRVRGDGAIPGRTAGPRGRRPGHGQRGPGGGRSARSAAHAGRRGRPRRRAAGGSARDPRGRRRRSRSSRTPPTPSRRRSRRCGGRFAGTIGRAGAFSFYATKTITTGEGGMLVTDDDALADRARSMRLHGIGRDAWKRYTAAGTWYYEIEAAGFKDNLTDLAAALGLAQLERAVALRAARAAIAARYLEASRGPGAGRAPGPSRRRARATSTPGTCSWSRSVRGGAASADGRRRPARAWPSCRRPFGPSRPRRARAIDALRHGGHRDQRPLHPAPPPPALSRDGLPARPVPGRRGGLRRRDQPADLARHDRGPGRSRRRRRPLAAAPAAPPADERARVLVVGAGYVGIITAVGLVELGHRVELVETRADRRAMLQRGEAPIFEAGLPEVLGPAVADDIHRRQRRSGRGPLRPCPGLRRHPDRRRRHERPLAAPVRRRVHPGLHRR